MVQEGKVLKITNINRTDAGEYNCSAYNGFGKPENRTVYVNITCELCIEKIIDLCLTEMHFPHIFCVVMYCVSTTFIDVWLSTSMQGSKLNFSKK